MARLAVCGLSVALLIFQGNVTVAQAQPAAVVSPVSVVSAAVLEFGSTSQYSAGSVKQFTVSTTRTAVITLPVVLPFTAVGGTCPLVATSYYGPNQITLAAGASCTIAMQFFPMQARAYAIQMPVAWAVIPLGTNVSQGSIPLKLVATSTPAPSPWTWSPSPLDFGGQVPYTTSSPRTMTLTTVQPAAILYISPVSAAFVRLGGTCLVTPHLAAGASCTLTFAFAPQGDGSQTAGMNIHWRPEGFPPQIGSSEFTTNITGTGVAPGNETAIVHLAYYATTSDTEAPHIHAGEQVAFVAAVKPAAGTEIVTGTVVLYDGVTAIGTAELNSYNGTSYATLFRTLTTGTHLITAGYAGNATFGTAFSEPLQIVVT